MGIFSCSFQEVHRLILGQVFCDCPSTNPTVDLLSTGLSVWVFPSDSCLLIAPTEAKPPVTVHRAAISWHDAVVCTCPLLPSRNLC